MIYKILTINPGSTSTKIAIFENEQNTFKKSIRHQTDVIQSFQSIFDQYTFREKAILDALAETDYQLSDFDAITGRGGMLKPIEGGTYQVNDLMIQAMKEASRGEHASNLGCVIAKKLADSINKPSFIVDPVAVDEMEDIARYTGMPEINRQSLFHALNQKAVALKAAKQLNKAYSDTRLIVAHLGGGISVGVHKNGRVIDVNNALDGDGPMSPERSGSVPIGPLYKMALSGKYTLKELKNKNYGNGGLVAHLGTNDGLEIANRIKNGDEKAKFFVDVMCYQIAKEIGADATVLEGDVDAIILTGGLAYDDYIMTEIKKRIKFIAPIIIYPGEDEMESLALGTLRVLTNEEQAKTYL